MAAIVKNSSIAPSLASYLPPATAKRSALVAGATIAAFDACYIDTTGVVQKSQDTGAATAPAQVHGYAATPAIVGQPITLWDGVEVAYTAAAGLTPGAAIFLSSAVAGGLDTGAANSHAPVGYAVTDRIAFLHRRTF